MLKLLITGANGLCGAALRELADPQQYQVYYTGRAPKPDWASDNYIQANLQHNREVDWLFDVVKPDYVVHTAAKVGGIGANMRAPAEYFRDNSLMNTITIDACRRYGVKKLIAFSSVCVFAPETIPLQEDKLQQGEPYPAHGAYAYAKRMVDIQIRACKKQYGIENWCSLIPGNIFGKNDLYDIEYGHIIPSLIHKLHKAITTKTDFVVWGTGVPLREFVYANDVARVIYELLALDAIPDRLIISGEHEYSIKEVVNKLVAISGYTGEIVWDAARPDGQRSRPSDKALFRTLLPSFRFTDFDAALVASWQWFVANWPNVRR